MGRNGGNRPNRGGGKYNKGKGGGAPGPPSGKGSGGGGGGRKGAAAAFLGDDDDIVLAVNQAHDDDGEQAESQERLKVEMQRLHLSIENQELLEATLLQVRGKDFALRKELSYKDSNRRLDHSYWIKDNQLLVRGVEDFSQPRPPPEEGQEQKLEASSWAMKKLLSMGWHRSRCEAALARAEGDVGLATEDLLAQSFGILLTAKQEEDVDRPGIEIVSSNEMPRDLEEDQLQEEEKNDEKMALQAIYESAFTEKIPGRVWELKLPIEHLWKYLPGEKQTKDLTNLQNQVGVCQFFLRGYCKFGRRCHKRHVQPEKEAKVEDHHLTGAKDQRIFILEIRFPMYANYPRDPCLVNLSTPMSQFPREHCMKITSALMQEAINQAKDSLPSVFSIVSILESESELDSIILGPPSKFSLPQLEQESSIAQGIAVDNSQPEDERIKPNRDEGRRREVDPRRRKEDNQRLRKRWQQIKEDGEDREMMKVRERLPAWDKRQEIIRLVESHPVLVISGMTGCGKSTQVPQYILENWLEGSGNHCSIVCTQPRRISAIGVASRVSAERCEPVGGLVGYSIRLEAKTSAKTRLLFCTTGILLKRLESDPLLSDVTHIIVDEVHERSEESDFLLMILRDTLLKRKDLRLILMSATVNAALFSSYFSNCPALEIPGRTYPVEQIFLEDCLDITGYAVEDGSPYARRMEKSQFGGLDKEIFSGDLKGAHLDNMDADQLLRGDSFKPAKDKLPDEECSAKQVLHRYKCEGYSDEVCRTLATMDWQKINYDLIERVVVFIADGGNKKLPLPREGSILVFLPGLQEISTLYESLSSHPRIGKKKNFLLVPLHSSLSSEEQNLVFSNPKGARKIVISTNIAETSITIEDCVFVVEVGKMKEKWFDPNKNMESLDTVWVSRASALQRKGRAGRVRPGFCFHLYTRFRYDHHFRNDPVPEIQRVPLEQMVLRIKILPCFAQKSVQQVLGRVLEPPGQDGVTSAILRLQDVGALYDDSSLTPLGYHLAQLPVDVRIGKLMILGAVLRCLDSALTIAACLAHRSPFVAPFKEREAANRARERFITATSDQMTAMMAYNAWSLAAAAGQHAGWVFSQENYLGQKSLQTIATLKHQFVELLASIGFIPGGVRMRDLERAARGKGGADAVMTVTGPSLNAYNSNNKVVSAVICAALYPNIVKVLSPEAKYKQTAGGAMARPNRVEDLKFKTHADGYVKIHPSSVCSTVANFETPYLVFHEKVKTYSVYVREVSMVPMLPMVLLGGSGIQVHRERGQFVISLERGWIKFVCDTHRIAELLKEIRVELESVLEEKISKPEMDLLTSPRGSAVISAIIKVMS